MSRAPQPGRDRTVDKWRRTQHCNGRDDHSALLARGGTSLRYWVKPDAALEYKLGRRTDHGPVMISDDVYTDSGKGTKPSAEKLQKAFGTSDPAEASKIILQNGELKPHHRAEAQDDRREEKADHRVHCKDLCRSPDSPAAPAAPHRAGHEGRQGVSRPAEGDRAAGQGDGGEAALHNTAKVRECGTLGYHTGPVTPPSRTPC